MTAQPGATTSSPPTQASEDMSRVYQEGVIAGLIGAASVAIWFLIVDTLHGRPLYTPTVLGTVLFGRGAVGSLDTLPVSLDMVLMFTWVHALVFAAIGGLASRLLAAAEEHPSLGFGVLLLFVFFEAGFTIVAMLLATPVLKALTWPAVLVANLIAAAAMAAYFWRRHPRLRIQP